MSLLALAIKERLASLTHVTCVRAVFSAPWMYGQDDYTASPHGFEALM